MGGPLIILPGREHAQAANNISKRALIEALASLHGQNQALRAQLQNAIRTLGAIILHREGLTSVVVPGGYAVDVAAIGYKLLDDQMSVRFEVTDAGVRVIVESAPTPAQQVRG